MIIPMLCVTIFVILVVWFLLPRVARLMIHTPTAISIFVCLSMVQLMAVFISLAGGAMSKLFGGGQKAASGGIQGDVLATDNNTVGMGDAGIKSAIQGSNVPNPDEAVPSFVSGAMAKAGKGL